MKEKMCLVAYFSWSTLSQNWQYIEQINMLFYNMSELYPSVPNFEKLLLIFRFMVSEVQEQNSSVLNFHFFVVWKLLRKQVDMGT